MARFNLRRTRPSPVSPVKSTRRSYTAEGAPGSAREPKSELFLLAVTNMVGEDTFYESGGDRDDRFTQLVRQVAVAGPGLDRRPAALAARRGPTCAPRRSSARAEVARARLDARPAGPLAAGRRRRAAAGRRAGRGAGLLDLALRPGAAQAGQARHRRRRAPALQRARPAQVRHRLQGLPLRRRDRPRAPVPGATTSRGRATCSSTRSTAGTAGDSRPPGVAAHASAPARP